MGAVIVLVERILRFGVWLILSATSKLFKHRGFLHSLIFLAAMSTVFIILETHIERNGLYMGIFLIGYGSHIATDMTTKQEVKLLHPFYKRRYHLLPPKWRYAVSRPVSVSERVMVLAICICVFALMRLE